jgi:hypothetical protein
MTFNALLWPRWLMENASAYCADACAEEDNINLYIYYIFHIIRHVCTYSPVPIRTFMFKHRHIHYYVNPRA